MITTDLISSILRILFLFLLLVNTSAARAVAMMMMRAPTNTLVPAVYTGPREAAAACLSRSADAETRNICYETDNKLTFVLLTDIGPIKIFKFTSLPHKAISAPKN